MLSLLLPLKQLPVLDARAAIGNSAAAAVIAHEENRPFPSETALSVHATKSRGYRCACSGWPGFSSSICETREVCTLRRGRERRTFNRSQKGWTFDGRIRHTKIFVCEAGPTKGRCGFLPSRSASCCAVPGLYRRGKQGNEANGADACLYEARRYAGA